MALTIDRLTEMANDIARFFRPYGDEEAVAGIAAHVDAFWTPAMRDALAAASPIDLDPLAAEALGAVVPDPPPPGAG